MGSKELHLNRTTSAGYRLAERPNADILTGHSKPAANSRTQGKPTYLATVQEDQVWRELIRAEWRGLKEWENNWSFLKDYDAKGQLKIHEPLPEYIPQFSDQVPNTTNQTCGSRIDTELGQALIQLDFRLQKENRKKKLDMELIPY
ncbi:ciliary microtubule inner protein 5 [Mustelus asterias]